MYAVWFYVRFPVSYRDLEEIIAERAVEVENATLNRWVEKYAEQMATEAQKRKAQPARSWRMDEIYIKVKGRRCYPYRAVDKFGNTLDFILSETRDEAAATRFFARTVRNNGWPDRFIKRITRQMKGFKSLASAQATLAEIETAHMIRKGQLAGKDQSAVQQFKARAG